MGPFFEPHRETELGQHDNDRSGGSALTLSVVECNRAAGAVRTVPFIVAALVAVLWLVLESRDPRPKGAEPGGAVLAAACLTSLVYGTIEQPTRAWDWVTVTTLAVGAVLLVAFAGHEARSPRPMLNVRLLANRAFTWASVGFGLVGLVLTGTMFTFTQYLQDVLGYRPLAEIRIIPRFSGCQVNGRLYRTGDLAQVGAC